MPNETAQEIMESIKLDALLYAHENGLRPPLNVTNAMVTDFGFKVTVVETKGSRMATCTFLSTGARSMYELDKKGGGC